MANLPPSWQGRGQAAAMSDATSTGQHRWEIGGVPLEHRGVSGRNPRRKHRATLPVHQRVPSEKQRANSTAVRSLSLRRHALRGQVEVSRG